MQTDQRLRLPEIFAHRAEAAKLRAADFCDVPEYVMGCEVQPVTPRTFSMLLASGNHFVAGGHPREDDVIDFIWFHSRGYVHADAPNWRPAKETALKPFLRQMRQPWRRWVGQRPDPDRQVATMVLACGEIRTLLDEAFACSPRGESAPVLATLEGWMIHSFAAAYGWAPERTRNTPLRQLFQLDRCLARSRGADVTDAGEDDIIAAHLRKRNEELQRAAAATVNGGAL